MKHIISFRDPPLVESVLSVQFGQLPFLTLLHAGRYWSEVLGVDKWSEVDEAGYLDDRFERFEEEATWAKPPQFKLAPASAPNRAQFRTADGDRMIQVQQSRFILNWLRRTSRYPRYSVLRDEFEQEYSRFVDFVTSLGAEKPVPNQWEVTYVNHLVRGEKWDTLEDWSRIFPSVSVPPSANDTVIPDVISLDSTYLIGKDKGRLRVSYRRAKHNETGQEVIRVDLTARGPVGSDSGKGLLDGLDLGRQAIVETFAAISSEHAHEMWGRTK